MLHLLCMKQCAQLPTDVWHVKHPFETFTSLCLLYALKFCCLLWLMVVRGRLKEKLRNWKRKLSKINWWTFCRLSDACTAFMYFTCNFLFIFFLIEVTDWIGGGIVRQVISLGRLAVVFSHSSFHLVGGVLNLTNLCIFHVLCQRLHSRTFSLHDRHFFFSTWEDHQRIFHPLAIRL